MPTYQYACTECGQPLEAVQSFSDPALTECPACHGRLRKVFNSVGIVFKGSGFYRNDARAAESGSGSESSEGSGEKSNAKEAAKSDTSSSSTSGGSSDSGSSSSGSSSTPSTSTTTTPSSPKPAPKAAATS